MFRETDVLSRDAKLGVPEEALAHLDRLPALLER